MLTIRDVAERTGLTAHTLRYYEKIGLLPSPDRKGGGVRVYAEGDVQYLQFLSSLKRTGMSLEEIGEFVKDGCILQKIEEGATVGPSLQKRIEILGKHLVSLEQQRQELDAIIALTHEKLGIYHRLLQDREQEKGADAR